MTVTGTGIASPGVNWVASIAGSTVTLGLGGSTQSVGATITFTTCTGQATYLSLNNTGTAGMSQINLIDTVTVTGANTMKLQSCNTGGVGTTNLAWDEVNNLCVGQVNTIASITAATSPLTTSAYSMIIAAGGTARLRALSSQNGKSITVSACPMTFDSAEYWRKRYESGGNSGAGSYGALADFKAQALNGFVERHGIESATEYGSGDGNQLSLLKISKYIGLDVSAKAIENIRGRYAGDASKSFFEYNPDDFTPDASLISDISLSMDVILHLTEDFRYEKQQLEKMAQHNRFRDHRIWMKINAPQWVESEVHLTPTELGYPGATATPSTPRHISSADPSPQVIYRGGNFFSSGSRVLNFGSKVHSTRTVSPTFKRIGVLRIVGDWSSKL
eukprot:gene5844-5912_t